MTAKEYLRQLRKLELKIRDKQKELDELRAISGSIGGIDYSKPRVQSSSAGDASFVNAVEKIAALEDEIRRDIADYLKLKHQIINQIYALSDDRYIKILYNHYANRKRLEDVAEEMNLSYAHILRLHGIAMKEFQKKFENAM